MSNIKFSKKLLKGKIAEFIFERMFLDSDKFTIVPLGYEKTSSFLAQSNDTSYERQIIKSISSIPDYAIIPKDKEGIYLVEVKYRSKPELENFKEIAEDVKKNNPNSWLFVVSPSGFYFSICSDVIKNDGKIDNLSETWVNKKLQDQYLELLNEFVGVKIKN